MGCWYTHPAIQLGSSSPLHGLAITWPPTNPRPLTRSTACSCTSTSGGSTRASATRRHSRMLCTLLWGWEMDSHSKNLQGWGGG